MASISTFQSDPSKVLNYVNTKWWKACGLSEHLQSANGVKVELGVPPSPPPSIPWIKTQLFAQIQNIF